MMDPDEELAKWVAFKRGGGLQLEVGVSRGVWLGGIFEKGEHEPFVYIGPDDWAEEMDLTFFSSHEEVEAFVAQLRRAAEEAWGPRA